MVDEVKIIFNHAIESLKVAELNLENGFYNASINRSYYAVFYAAKALLFKNGIEPKKHSGTIRQFGLEYVINGNFDCEISKILSILEEDRSDADYDFNINFTENRAAIDLKNARLFIEESKKFI